ncbi:hypothetical protein BU14_0051s0014 [Porphyra umbilicalis]|uniref:Uncharacterized protein n=1 Tax=Porphyra umbilicalis TaxID=2786 RepID=A0A1X6PHY4_PORUM|nr:hypothetical protein BU14_0051s0014 [Porphyra umbilicalis]|eukprot:OSX80494.1 hypothetical protein BU14_0051s0014 [Porphyra umbilicalis]
MFFLVLGQLSTFAVSSRVGGIHVPTATMTECHGHRPEHNHSSCSFSLPPDTLLTNFSST